jgi:hypothetical protein
MSRTFRAGFWKVAGAIVLAAALAVLASAKKKDKPVLPEFVLRAETITVVILPQTGEPVNDPLANHKAQEDVEKALMRWGRFILTQETSTADLVIAVRKGSGKIVNPTISGGPIDSRPVTVESTDSAIRIGGKKGSPNGAPEDTSRRPALGMETGTIAGDRFEVLQGGNSYSGEGAPVWSYNAKDALKAPNVPAVAEFRKAIEESLKANAQKQKQTQQQGQKTSP